MRLIDADELDLYECLKSYYGDAWRDAQKAIDNAPTVDPIKHGHWIECKDYHSWECSVCHTWSVVGGHYCDWCGAKMDEVT